MSNTKILITGGAGFIGSNLALEIQRRFSNSKITILDDFSSGVEENLKEFKGEVIRGDIEDESLIKSLKGKKFEIIFHQAAITDTTVEDKDLMMRVNLEGFKNILNLAKSENSKVIYASSAGVYGNGPIPMKESQRLAPLNAYAESKVRIDKLAMDFANEENLKIIGLRYFNVYGPGEKHKGKSASMIWQLYCQMREGKAPRIFKYGEQKRDFIYVKDCVEATLKACELNESIILNVGTGVSTTFNRIIEILNRVLNTNFSPEYFDNPYDFYQNNTQADTTLLEKILGFKARYSIEEGIFNYVGGK
jgi:ADP-L-glycero-D-manno-heptose 6-epimerase